MEKRSVLFLVDRRFLTHGVAPGKLPVSDPWSNQARNSTHIPPLPSPVIEETSTPPPVTTPAPRHTTVLTLPPSPAVKKTKIADQLRAKRVRKGKTKAAAIVTEEDPTIKDRVKVGGFVSALGGIDWEKLQNDAHPLDEDVVPADIIDIHRRHPPSQQRKLK